MENFIGERVSKMLYTLDGAAGQEYVLITLHQLHSVHWMTNHSRFI